MGSQPRAGRPPEWLLIHEPFTPTRAVLNLSGVSEVVAVVVKKREWALHTLTSCVAHGHAVVLPSADTAMTVKTARLETAGRFPRAALAVYHRRHGFRLAVQRAVAVAIPVMGSPQVLASASPWEKRHHPMPSFAARRLPPRHGSTAGK